MATGRHLSHEILDSVLEDLGLTPSRDARGVLEVLASDPTALHRVVRRLADHLAPDESIVPAVDGPVERLMKMNYATCIEARVLKKPKKMGRQNKLLLAALLERLGEPVSLQELLLINGLHNATSRRLRELGSEHGHFKMRVEGTGDSTAYVLESATPDLDATAYYWLKSNIRGMKRGDITPRGRLLALLSARLGNVVTLDDLAYVLPKSESAGKGRARAPQLAVARRIRELREDGYRVASGKERVGLKSSDYLLETLTKLPPYERIKASVREGALAGARYRCQHCGWGPEDGPERGKKQLEVHHENPQRARPDNVNDPKNLAVLCNVCHAGVEASAKKRG